MKVGLSSWACTAVPQHNNSRAVKIIECLVIPVFSVLFLYLFKVYILSVILGEDTFLMFDVYFTFFGADAVGRVGRGT